MRTKALWWKRAGHFYTPGIKDARTQRVHGEGGARKAGEGLLELEALRAFQAS